MTPLTPVPDPPASATSAAPTTPLGTLGGAVPPPEILRCSDTADFLAALPVLTGFTAENSLFVVCFQGNRAGNVMRINLPDADGPKAAKGFLDSVISLLRQTGAGAERPALVLTTTLTFGETGGVPRGRLAQQLKQRVRREGWRLRDLAVIASDGWCGLLRNGSGAPRSLSEIAQSPIAAEARRHTKTVTDIAALGKLPVADPLRTASIESHLTELQQRRLASSTHPAANMERRDRALLKIRQAARIAEACFAPQQRQVADRLLAKLIDSVQQQTGWLVCVLTALTRAEFVVDVAHETGTDRLTDIHVESEPSAKLGTREGWNIRHLLTSLAHEMPPRERLRKVIAVVEDAIAHAPTELQPPLFAILAWAWWANGMQSVAARIAAEGLAAKLDHELLLMVQQLCEAPPSAHLLRLRDELARAA